MKKTPFHFFVLLFVFTAFFVSAQEQQIEPTREVLPPENSDTENTGTVYVIREIEFDVEGRSRPYALIANGGFKEGERVIGKENLDKYLADRRQALLNQQVLEEVSIEYSIGEYAAGEHGDDNALPVKLLVHVKDTWNFIILPYPKYDSNEGFSVTLKARDYNFLGTMSALSVDLGYSQENNENTVNFSIDTDIPFRAAGLDWNLNFDHSLSYTFDEPLYYQNVTGLSLQLPWKATTFTAGFNQYLTINEENSDENIDIYDLDERFPGPYGSTELFVAWKIPFGLEVGDFGELSYTPRVSGRINYPYGSMDEPRKPLTEFSHSIGFGKVDWIGNYRKGLSVSAGNSYGWYIDRGDAPLKIGLDGEAKFYWPFSQYFGVTSRLTYRQWWHRSDKVNDFIPYYRAGDTTRGVLDEDIRAYQILSFNLDIPVRLLRFWPSEWFNNKKLHLFDFEMHFSPFTDMVIFRGPYNKIKNADEPAAGKTAFGFEDMINTAGIEILVFPGFFRSLKIRASIAYNINRIRNEGLSLKGGFFPAWDEIFIGLDHHY